MSRIAAGIVLAAIPGAAIAQAHIPTADDCRSQADEVACLRQALEQSRAALSRAAGKAPHKHAKVAQRAEPAPAAPEQAQLGAEQVPAERHRATARNPKSKWTPAVVAAVETDPRGQLLLRLENGQIWREAERPDIPLSLGAQEQLSVEIARSGFGGYRMRFPDMRRQIIVERIK